LRFPVTAIRDGPLGVTEDHSPARPKSALLNGLSRAAEN
jgi:hypothetical protein